MPDLPGPGPLAQRSALAITAITLSYHWRPWPSLGWDLGSTRAPSCLIWWKWQQPQHKAWPYQTHGNSGFFPLLSALNEMAPWAVGSDSPMIIWKMERRNTRASSRDLNQLNQALVVPQCLSRHIHCEPATSCVFSWNCRNPQLTLYCFLSSLPHFLSLPTLTALELQPR